MSRIQTPSSIDAAPAAARPLLDAVQQKLGSVPNMFRLVSASPATLEGYLGLSGALAAGQLSPAAREGIALVLANINGCTYCNSAHGYIAKNLIKMDDQEIDANRDATSSDPKTDAILKLARKIASNRGQVEQADLDAARAAGATDTELVEVVGNVALNVLTNYINEVFKTDVDFPLAEAKKAA
ncbi:MAG: peroxidase-related enzyme [Rhodospirillales bacterium]|nr:peroxidase-related enzyme [Rhodospirillales bacterium]